MKQRSDGRTYMSARRRRSLTRLHDEDPMASMVNLLDVFILTGVGFLIVALSGFGLKELLSRGDLTVVKDPGGPNMELIRKQGNKIERLRNTGGTAKIGGQPIGTVYRLENGDVIWVPKVEGQ
jgi:hypothetical protein